MWPLPRPPPPARPLGPVGPLYLAILALQVELWDKDMFTPDEQIATAFAELDDVLASAGLIRMGLSGVKGPAWDVQEVRRRPPPT